MSKIMKPRKNKGVYNKDMAIATVTKEILKWRSPLVNGMGEDVCFEMSVGQDDILATTTVVRFTLRNAYPVPGEIIKYTHNVTFFFDDDKCTIHLNEEDIQKDTQCNNPFIVYLYLLIDLKRAKNNQ